MMRVLRRLHRWFGLATAAFLVLAGLTGAVIAFDHELDRWLAPELYVAASGDAPAGEPLELADNLEASDRRLTVVYLPLATAPGDTLLVSVAARDDGARETEVPLEADQVAIDPATGAVQAQRLWGEPALRRAAILPFLYKLHYSLQLPATLGTTLMGIVALVWVVDSCVALVISFPEPKLWRRSFQFSWRSGGRRLLFDLHRSGGVWGWLLLLPMAVTALSMNLESELVRPVVGWFSPVAPDPFARRIPEASDAAAVPRVSRREAVAIARADAARRGWTAPAGAVFDAKLADLYAVGFFAPGEDHGDGGLGNPWLYVDARSGAIVAAQVPGEGSAGDLFLQAQFPVHSGRIAGFAGRVLVAALGLVVGMLPVTGVWLWSRRQFAGRWARSQEGADAS